MFGRRGHRTRLSARLWRSGRGRSRRSLALAEARLEIFVKVGFRMQCPRPRDENLFGFEIVRIGDAAIDGADRRAGLIIMKTHALRAEERVDDIDRIALADRVIRALGLAGAAIDALAGNRGGH